MYVLQDFFIFSSEREYEETGSEREEQEDLEGELDEIIDEENEAIERAEDEQEREDQEMMEGHQRNHIGTIILGVEPDKTLAMILSNIFKNWIVAIVI